MSENVNIINQGFRYLLKALAPYLARDLQIEYKNDWWREGVLNTLRMISGKDFLKKVIGLNLLILLICVVLR